MSSATFFVGVILGPRDKYNLGRLPCFLAVSSFEYLYQEAMTSLPSRPAEEKPLQRADEVNDVSTALGAEEQP